MKSDSPKRDEQNESFPRTLLSNPTATLYFDGLIFAAYNRERQLYQAGIHTQAEHHELVVEVTTGGGGHKLWPKTPADWDPSHDAVRAAAPLWLYVDSGGGLRPEEFSAELHRPDDLKDPQSFGHVLDFEGGLYKRRVGLRPDALSAFNFPNGTFYSAQNVEADLNAFDQGKPSGTATLVEKILVSTLGAADIDARSEGGVERHIVLAKNDGADELFRFRLEEGTHYEIKVMNEPVKGHTVHRPEDHFLQFYELFPLRPGEKVFLVEPAEAASLPPNSPDSPPCIQGKGSLSTGLP